MLANPQISDHFDERFYLSHFMGYSEVYSLLGELVCLVCKLLCNILQTLPHASCTQYFSYDPTWIWVGKLAVMTFKQKAD